MHRSVLVIVFVCLSLIPQNGVVAQTVSTEGQSRGKAGSDVLYQKLRRTFTGEDFNRVATVKGFSLQREAATFNFKSGEIYFLAPVEGRTVGAVFLGEGEMTLAPPTDAEKRSLALFAGQPILLERFTRLVMRFTDQTFQEIERSSDVQMTTGGVQAGRARDAYADNQTFLHKEAHYNVELRTLADLYASQRPGFFMAFPSGGRFGNLVYQIDPLVIPEVSPEQVALFSFNEAERGIWAAFHRREEYEKGTASSTVDRRLYDISRHEVANTIRGTRIIASDRVSLTALVPDTRVLPLELYRTLRVSRVRDEQGSELTFVQEGKDDDADFGIVLPQALEVGKKYQFTIEYEGDEALRDSGGGNFILVSRHSWYPTNTSFGDRALFEMTFSYPKDFTLVGTGSLTGPEQQEGGLKVAKWTSGNLELSVAGFNYGKFRRKDLQDSETGYKIEFYANKDIPDELKDLDVYLETLGKDKVHITGISGGFSTTNIADVALNDTQNATRIYSAYFGKLPYTRIALSQQPVGNFGQAWPTLIYMPYIAFIDQTQRTQLLGARGGADTFWRYVGPHEVAHQWWGHIIGWTSYRDQWMSEGFAEFSTSLYVQYVRKDMKKFTDFWDEQRKMILEATPLTNHKKPYTIGPITQGYRLNSGKTGPIARFMIYPKGAYILHMIRMMMYDHRGGGDAKFRAMMTDFVQSNFNRNVSTEDFQRAVEKHMTPQMDVDKNGRMDWFFDEWVYGTDIPAYRIQSQSASSPDGKPAISLRITQSGVSDSFRMLVPIYADFGKGWTRLGAAKMTGNTSVDIPNIPVPETPKRVTLCALNDVLFTSLN